MSLKLMLIIKQSAEVQGGGQSLGSLSKFPLILIKFYMSVWTESPMTCPINIPACYFCLSSIHVHV